MDEFLEQELLEEQRKLEAKERAEENAAVAASAAQRAAREKQIEELSHYFGPGSSSAAVSKLQREDPQKYATFRKLAVENGLLFDAKATRNNPEPEADTSRMQFGQRANPGATLLNQHWANKPKQL